MSGIEPRGRATVPRVLGGVLLGVLASVTFVLLGAGVAHGQVTVQDSEVNNVGVGVANSGGNTATGNETDGDQTAVNGQAAVGAGGLGIANNTGTASNTSSGDATIVTGGASATGNQSATTSGQSANSVGGGGLGVTVQDADTNNVGVGVANSGFNDAVGNDSDGDQTAVNGQLAVGVGGLGIANNTGAASNVSRGTATIVTGPASAVGNQSVTGVSQSANNLGGLFGPGLGIVVQDADTNNIGLGIANSGFNDAVGNDSDGDQVALNLQAAFGIGGLGIANNLGSAKNVSSGDALIVTGPATAIGNQSITGVSQSANVLGGWFLPAVILQDADTNNIGFGFANSGFNDADGNESDGDQLALNLQAAFGIGGLGIANNTGGASNVSTGSATIVSGGAHAVGNRSATTVTQSATSTGFVGPTFFGLPWWWWLFF